MLHPEKDGLRTRQSFSKIKEVIEMPNLIEVQKIPMTGLLKKVSRKFSKILIKSKTIPGIWF